MPPLARAGVRFTLAVVMLLGAGCSGIGAPDPPGQTNTPRPTGPNSGVQPPSEITGGPPVTENIDSVLAGLVRADNRSRYAAAHDLDYRAGRVLVVIELVANGSIPDQYDLQVEHRVAVADGVVVQGYLDVDQIQGLVSEPVVRSIRAPESPSTIGG